MKKEGMNVDHMKNRSASASEFSEFEKTGVFVVDLLAQCVGYHKKYKLDLKCIYLKKALYNKFMEWVKRSCTPETWNNIEKQDGLVFHFAGVDILPASMFSTKDIDWEFKTGATDLKIVN